MLNGRGADCCVERRVQSGTRLMPFGRIERDNGADGGVGDSGRMGVPEVQAGASDDGCKAGGLLGSAQRRGSGMVK